MSGLGDRNYRVFDRLRVSDETLRKRRTRQTQDNNNYSRTAATGGEGKVGDVLIRLVENEKTSERPNRMGSVQNVLGQMSFWRVYTH